ncbi:hypothetical protein SAMN04487906_1809 [Zhouia amylolytica]|uniref:Uncharacterized protein n=1 Tax=Zhouia amylolytica TaxID=376730 RepID=A0A1I6T2I5_9FLAO|nr:hypothetical protein [Zhouia amylolytica]MCQ0112600.1 hypothetical protein [Zhouia amylolytica]SFS83494.1 hypothetical protein SAMN04487906_1809 [Zhouia amylolytica]
MIKNRILKGWNILRLVFLGVGVLVLIQGIQYGQWPGLLLGLYLFLKGLLGLGCAGGYCSGGGCDISPEDDIK